MTNPPDNKRALYTNDNEPRVELFDPDIEAVPLETNASNATNESVYDEDDPDEQDPAYFAPVDPVFTTDRDGNIAVLNGFAPSSSDEADNIDVSDEDHQYGDDALADAVIRTLRADALTTDLTIDVVVDDGVVYLHGEVPAYQDVLNVEEIAARVPGIREVVEELDIAGM